MMEWRMFNWKKKIETEKKTDDGMLDDWVDESQVSQS